MTDREKVAAALWRNEAERVDRNTTARRRTLAAFADESEYTRSKWLSAADAAIAAMQPVSVEEAAKVLLETYDRDFPMRTADFHATGCQCLRCAIDALRALAQSDREAE